MIVEPADVPGAGRFAVLAGPQGAVFATLRPEGEAPGHGTWPNRGLVSWHELATTDHEAAFEFYHALFGWEKTDTMDMGPMGTYQLYRTNGTGLGGMYNKPADMPAPPHWPLYFMVEDVDALAKKMEQLGGKVLTGPMDVPGGDRVVQCLDPQGAAFAYTPRPLGGGFRNASRGCRPVSAPCPPFPATSPSSAAPATRTLERDPSG